MRYVLLATLVGLACRSERAEGTRSEGADPRPEAAVSAAPAAYHPSGVTDDELVAYVRWQREHTELFGRYQAAQKAISPDPSMPFDEAVKEAVRQGTEEDNRFLPLLKKVLGRRPLDGTRADLVTEVAGGLAHWEPTPTGDVRLVVGRDEERLGAARRRFGDKAVDDLLARESLILAQLQ